MWTVSQSQLQSTVLTPSFLPSSFFFLFPEDCIYQIRISLSTIFSNIDTGAETGPQITGPTSKNHTFQVGSHCCRLNENCPQQAHVSEHIFPGWWHYMGRLWDSKEIETCWRKYVTVCRLPEFIALPYFCFLLCFLCEHKM